MKRKSTIQLEALVLSLWKAVIKDYYQVLFVSIVWTSYVWLLVAYIWALLSFF